MKNNLLNTVKKLDKSIEATNELLAIPNMKYQVNIVVPLSGQDYLVNKAFWLPMYPDQSPTIIKAKELIDQLHQGKYCLGCQDGVYLIRIEKDATFRRFYGDYEAKPEYANPTPNF